MIDCPPLRIEKVYKTEAERQAFYEWCREYDRKAKENILKRWQLLQDKKNNNGQADNEVLSDVSPAVDVSSD